MSSLFRRAKIDPHAENGSSAQSFEQDIAAAIVPEHAQAIDRAIEKRVLRKIDLFLIPLMWIGYGFVYYDKACSRHPLSLF